MKLEIRAARVALAPPKGRTGEPDLEMLAVSAVETHPPAEAEPVAWLLLASAGDACAEDARTAVRRYRKRIGDFTATDHMFLDGLEDAYDKGRLMGTFAEDCASAYQFTRKEQDEFAIGSLRKAQSAIRCAEWRLRKGDSGCASQTKERLEHR